MEKKLLILTFSLISIFSGLQAQLSYKWDQSIPVTLNDNPLSIPWAGGINSPQISKIDLDGDSVEDLVIFDRTNNKLSTFLFSTTGYQYQPEYESYFPEGLKGWVLLRDYNCDGLKDLFSHTPFGIKVYENTTLPGEILSWELVFDPIFTEGFSGQINLQVNVMDMPGIADLDGDGDLDILVYDFAVGGGIEYHKNLSMENAGICGIEFERISKEWGDFSECICDIFAFEDETCEDLEGAARVKHIGGKTILTFDTDNDGDHEALIGQEDCEPLYFLENSGTPDDALMLEFSTQFPNTDNPINGFHFPAAYFEDLDGDGLKDMASSTNFSDNHDNELDFRKSLWFYKNIGSAEIPEFEFVTENFLQNEMLDLGERAHPAFTDFDRDGDMDLFISHKGIPDSGQLTGSLWYMQNIGSTLEPSFTLIDEDYLALSSLKLSDLSHQFVDMNADNNPDLVVMGSKDGIKSGISILFNKSGSIFSFTLSDRFELPIEFSSGDQFHMFDINGDRLVDLLLARSSGQLDYYRNIGTGNSPEFILDTEGFYGIAADFSSKRLSVSVADLDFDDINDLLTIDENGLLTWYSAFLNSTSAPQTGEELVFEGINSDSYQSYNFGNQSSITTARIFQDAEPSIIVGLASGGLQILRKTDPLLKPPTDEEDFIVIIYPNPTMGLNNGIVTVSSTEEGRMQVISSTGQEVSQKTDIRPGQSIGLDTRAMPNGLYLVKTESKTGRIKTLQLVVIN